LNVVALPVEVQGRRLVQAYPTFTPVAMTGWFGIWEGTLRPVMQSYRIRVKYIRYNPFTWGLLDHPHVEVFVLDPKVGHDPRGTGEPPPHVFLVGHDPEFPALCLFDPARREWSPADHIEETIIPWSIEWLMWFELWVWDGIWRGGGRHPGEAVVENDTADQGEESNFPKPQFDADSPGLTDTSLRGGVSRLALVGPFGWAPAPPMVALPSQNAREDERRDGRRAVTSIAPIHESTAWAAE
jgi:hypothetical protein